MSDGIRQEARRITAQEQSNAEARTKSARDRALLEQHWRQAWLDVVAALKADVAAYGEPFPREPDDLRLLEVSPVEIRIERKDSSTPRMIRVVAAQEGITISSVAPRQAREFPLPAMETKQLSLVFTVDSRGSVGVAKQDQICRPNEVSERILRALFP